MPTKEASPISIPEEKRGITPESGPLGETGKSPEELSVPRTPQETTSKEILLPSETQPETVIFQTTPEQPKPDTQTEIQPYQEENPLEKPEKERPGWLERLGPLGRPIERRANSLMRRLEEEGVTLTKEDKRKLFSIAAVWMIHAVVSTGGGASIAGGSIWSLIRYRDLSRLPSFLSYNLLIQASIRLGATIAFEQPHIKFDGWSKLASFFSGWGMPVEIAVMSKKSAKHRMFFRVLFNEVKEHYVTNPLAHARSLYGRARKIIRR